MLSSFTSYQRLQERGGVGVGGHSLQDIINFDGNHRISPDTAANEACSLRLVVDCDREEPFFVLLMSTQSLLSQFDITGTIETEHEGYPFTLIGQRDMNRRFHLIHCILFCKAVGISTKSTQDVGEIFMRTSRDNVPNLRPSAYLGDAAEAFANASQAVSSHL